MLGLHLLDIFAICIYFFIVVFIGIIARKRIHHEEDFFLGGRKFGKIVSIFLAFGTGTSSDTAISASREAYRYGMSGIWVQLLWLFVTPFYWIIAPWYRRLRIITGGDYFQERFKSHFLTYMYVLFGLLWFMFYIAIGLTAVGKTVEVVTVKPASRYTWLEKQRVAEFSEYNELLKRQSNLTEHERERLAELKKKIANNEIKPFYSYIDSRLSLPVIALVVLIYGVLGGLFAAAWTDTFQGILIIILSVLLLPTGLHKIGWFSGLHAQTPAYMFNLIGTAETSEYTWYYIVALMMLNLVGVVAQPHIFSTGGGAAKDELTARIGLVFGNYFKRITTIFWGFTGVLAFALFGKVLTDPDMIWGYATHQLLGPGFVGLMIACLLAAVMSSADAFMISGSALFTKNLYQVLKPNMPESHYVYIGRLVSIFMVIGAVALSIYFNNVLSLIKYIWQLPVIFGSVFWLSILWRKVTRTAAVTAVIFSSLTIIVLPGLLPQFDGISTNPRFLAVTKAQTISVRAGATAEDVNQGLADKIGEVIIKKHQTEPTPIFFEKIIEPKTESGTRSRGSGKLAVNLFFLDLMGIHLSALSKPALMTLSYFIDILMPFVIMFIISLFTRPLESSMLDRFFARFHTPVEPTPEKDWQSLEKSLKNPHRFDENKLFPRSSWEILKPSPTVIWGFLGCFGIAILIYGLAIVVAKINVP